MENGQKTVFQLFNGEKHFIVPRYQRSYAWEEKQRKDFLEDIQNQRFDKDYFLGTILFQDKGIIDGFESIEIVDGQQRLTTLVIFMKVLLKELSKRDNADYSRALRRYLKDETFYKLELIQQDNDFFKTYIIDDNEFEENFIETPSQRRLYEAKTFFEQQLNDLDVKVLKEYAEKIEKVKVLTYSVTDTAEATLIFETTNDRGKSLTNLEKTKSFLMHKLYLSKDKPQELLASIHDRFSEIYRILDDIKKFGIPEDSILQYHFIGHMRWTVTRQSKGYQKYVAKLKAKVNGLLHEGKFEDAAVFIDKYSRELKESFGIIREILCDRNSLVRDLVILKKMAFFYPLLIKCYKADRAKGKTEYYSIVKLLEIVSFRVYGIGRKPSHTGETWLYELARDFKGDFDLLREQLARLIGAYVDQEKFVRELASWGFYYLTPSPIQRYLFWKYENYLRENEQPKAAPMSEEEFLTQSEKYRLTVEHIACQTPSVTTQALKLPEITEEFEKQFLHKIGNLTFDPNSANASKGNNSMEIKNSRYFQKAPFKTQNELDAFIKEGAWTPASIDERSLKIIQFALSYWEPKQA